MHTLRIGCLDPTKDMCSKSISSGAQYVTLKKYFSRPNLVIYFLATPHIKLKLGQQTGGGVLIANHLDQSLWWVNQKHSVVVRSYLLHSFLAAGAQVLRLPFSHFKLCNYTEPIPLPWAKPVYFWLSFIQLYCAGSHTDRRWRCSHTKVQQETFFVLRKCFETCSSRAGRNFPVYLEGQAPCPQ